MVESIIDGISKCSGVEHEKITKIVDEVKLNGYMTMYDVRQATCLGIDLINIMSLVLKMRRDDVYKKAINKEITYEDFIVILTVFFVKTIEFSKPLMIIKNEKSK